MEEKLQEIVVALATKHKTISTMESCTGGFLANQITNVEGSSEIFKFGAVTYSNQYKIKMGVSKETIDTYSVYSINTAREMSKSISSYTNSDYSIGITGKLGSVDLNNDSGLINEVFVSIYDKEKNQFTDFNILVKNTKRGENKKEVANKVFEVLYTLI